MSAVTAVTLPMRPFLPNPKLLPLFLALASGCQPAAPPAPPAPVVQPAPVVEEDPCRPEAIIALRQVMSCQISPFPTMGRGDEATFRKALAALKTMVPEDAYAKAGDPASWLEIIGKMEQTGDFKAGCKSCHVAWKADYHSRFRERRVR